MVHGEPATLSGVSPALDPIVSAAWLADHRSQVVVADVRWYLNGSSGLEAYRVGHVPGAVWVDLDAVLAAPPAPAVGRHPLPAPEQFAAGLAAAGIGETAQVVAYDDLGGMAAGRLVWLLRRLGLAAALLDGGLAAWPGPLASGDERLPPATFAPRPWPQDAFATAEETGAAAADGSAVVLDARAPERFRGEVEPIDARPGHIPGARNAPFAANLDPEGRFLSPTELRQRYGAYGVGDDNGAVIVYCGSGVSACHDLLALERAGVAPERVRLYPGSWSQWAADPTRPVATGG